MKKLTYLVCFSLLTLTGCHQEEEINDLNFKSTKNEKAFKQFYTKSEPLMPTGDSTLDTENLQAAIHDSKLDDGGTLYLGPGTFLVHASIVRHANYSSDPFYNPIPFNGNIQGAGKGKTIIKSVRGPGGVDFAAWIDPIFFFTPSTLVIQGEEYTGIRDLTFEADSEILASWNYGGNINTKGLLNYVLLGSGIKGVKGSSDCINVHFKGSLDSSGKPENAHLFEVWDGVDAIHNIKSCEFDNGLLDMLTYAFQDKATINIGGNASEKLTFTNSIFPGIQIIYCGNASINVSNIETHDAPGFFFASHMPNTISTITVKKSDINQVPGSGYGGIELHAIRGEVSAEISQNKIHSEDSWLWGPIFSGGLENLVIKNNKFIGNGYSAIYLSIYYGLPGHTTLVGNNFGNWENYSGLNPWLVPAAPIWLGSYITDSFVVGGNNKVNIFDEPGYDEFWNPAPPDEDGNAQTYDENGNLIPKNNIFTGVNNMHVNLGQGIRDAMRQKVDAKEAKIYRRSLK